MGFRGFEGNTSIYVRVYGTGWATPTYARQSTRSLRNVRTRGLWLAVGGRARPADHYKGARRPDSYVLDWLVGRNLNRD